MTDQTINIYIQFPNDKESRIKVPLKMGVKQLIGQLKIAMELDEIYNYELINKSNGNVLNINNRINDENILNDAVLQLIIKKEDKYVSTIEIIGCKEDKYTGNESRLADESIEDADIFIKRRKRNRNQSIRFSKLVIAIPVAFLILCSLVFWYLLPKDSTTEMQPSTAIRASNEQDANEEENVDQSLSMESPKKKANNVISNNKKGSPVIEDKPLENNIDASSSGQFVIRFDVPASKVETETRVLVKLVKGSPQMIMFYLESPFYRVENGPVGPNGMPSLAWAPGAVHIFSDEYVTMPGKVDSDGNDMRITDSGQMVMVLQEGNVVDGNLLENWQIDSEHSYPIMFKVVKDVGYVYMCGSGTVTSPSGKIYELGKDDTPEKWIELLASNDSLIRESAVVALGYLGGTQSVSYLMKALKDSDLLVRRSAAESLGKIGDKAAMPALEATIADKHSWTAVTAKWAIAKIKSTDDNSLIAKRESKTDTETQEQKSIPKQSHDKKVDQLIEEKDEKENKSSENNIEVQDIRRKEAEGQIVTEENIAEKENDEQQISVRHDQVAKNEASSSSDFKLQTVSDDKEDIKNIVLGINDAIETNNIDKFCQFLTKKDKDFYLNEQKIMKEFINEIQVMDSSFNNVNIVVDGNTANVSYKWNIDFKWNVHPGKEFKNSSNVSLKLKKYNAEWQVFDADVEPLIN